MKKKSKYFSLSIRYKEIDLCTAFINFFNYTGMALKI